jgi:hypothetical protein
LEKTKKLTKYKKNQKYAKFGKGVLNNVGRPHKKMGQKTKNKKIVPRVSLLALGEEIVPREPKQCHSGKRPLPREHGAGSQGRF